MRIVPFKAVYPNTSLIASNDSFFGTVKSEYAQYARSGFFKLEDAPAFYICQINNKRGSHTGFICCVDINDYKEDRIKKHEKVLPAKIQRQMHLLLMRKAQVKPVLFTYDHHKEIDEILRNTVDSSKPFLKIHFEDDDENQAFWRIDNPKLIGQLQSLFDQKVPHVYIADGHHRCNTTAMMYDKKANGSKYNPYGELLSAFFPKSQVSILDYNRVVEGLNGLSPTQFIAKISKYCKISILKQAARPEEKYHLTMFFNNEWYGLRWRRDVRKSGSSRTLDASLLDHYILDRILGIEDVGTDSRIRFIEGPKGLDEIIEKTLQSAQRIGFCLRPVALEDLVHVVDAGEIMPPKSTWFEPRLKNGVIVKSCE